MMDTNDASDVFSGDNKYQTILFILIFIFIVIQITRKIDFHEISVCR